MDEAPGQTHQNESQIQDATLGRDMKTTYIMLGLLAGVVALSAEITQTTAAAATASTGVAPQASSAATPNPAPPPSSSAPPSASELEKLVMPIALHPDTLIAIILPAAAYPLEIVQAARLVKNTNNIPKIDQQSWDENVKAVARIPELIAQMDADLNWTMELGQTFVDHPKELMDTIQSLRARALKAGTLQTTPQQVISVTNVIVIETNVTQVVTVTNQIVQVVPANPQVVYVPTYSSVVYYPPPAYVYDPYAPLVTFGVGIAVGAIIANNCDWHHGGVYVGHHGAVWVGGGHGDVDIDVNRNVNVNQGQRPGQQPANRPANTGAPSGQQKWQPDQKRRAANVPASVQNRESRGYSNAGAQPSQRPAGSASARPAQPTSGAAQRPAAATQPARSPGAGQGSGVAQRPATASRPTTTQSAASRPAPSQAASRPSSGSSSAFSGVNSGSSARAQSSRGAVSRSSGGGMSRGGGGGRGGGRGR